MQKVCVVVPNWNGEKSLADCLDSLLHQSLPAHIIVIDNGSTDGSLSLLAKSFPQVEVLAQKKNYGFAGGVNRGIERSMQIGSKFIALINNDAAADKDWLKDLVQAMQNNSTAGIVTSKILSGDGQTIDSTGDFYTIWGLPHPRGRGEKSSSKFDNDTAIFGGSGGASLYRAKMLRQVGLFDEDFFAYYEDIDLSFRAQLAGWKVVYAPKAVVHHQIGATSSKISGFTTYHTLKNLPWLLWKNVPWPLMPKVLPRLTLAYSGIAGRALQRGQFGPFFKALFVGTVLWPKKMFQRHKIQGGRKVSPAYINSIIIHDLPPNAHALRSLRNKWWALTGKAKS
ncbi:hypothetical protein A3E49_02590 [Candidatus Saccharibacteria bacterium RIFCSPHIGHO2_12_FULL_49_19]|nr:MAG: hypothetical protein A3B63_03645 [Candidatus Saccharibacteria bacterium RIFCSPLOWO2_01_FULL_49_22]OGL37186.1 MAG: hypothetical protein A3E49_02590 [Candidatus Saccharibacteria bacterium RIFCSPHIGHO2_12_FULL_49_19]